MSEENIKNKYNKKEKINKCNMYIPRKDRDKDEELIEVENFLNNPRYKCNMYIPPNDRDKDEELIEVENFLINPRYYSKFSSYLYSVGLTIYYLYFGKLPYSKFSFDEFNMLLDNPQNINVTIVTDRNLEDLINKILKKNIKDRIDWKGYFSHPFFKQYNY